MRKNFLIGLVVLGGFLMAGHTGIRVLKSENPPKPPSASVPILQSKAAEKFSMQPVLKKITSPALLERETVVQEVLEVRTPIPAMTEAVAVKPEQTCPKPLPRSEIDHLLTPLGPDFSIEQYIPSGLVPVKNIPTGGRFLCLTREALAALESLTIDAEKEGAKITLISAFRSRTTQEWLVANRGTTRPGSLYPSIANPGHSEHQLGTTVDFTSGSNPTLTFDAFANSPEYAWLTEHGWKYGFVQSYPVGSESITGYIAEPWHWRYVGPAIAEALHKKKNLTLYEYLKEIGNPFSNIGG